MLGLECHKRENNLKWKSERRISTSFQLHLSCSSSGLPKLSIIKVPFEHMWIMPFVKAANCKDKITITRKDDYFPARGANQPSQLKTLCPWLGTKPTVCLRSAILWSFSFINFSRKNNLFVNLQEGNCKCRHSYNIFFSPFQVSIPAFPLKGTDKVTQELANPAACSPNRTKMVVAGYSWFTLCM